MKDNVLESAPEADKLIIQSLARLDPLALGTALGAFGGLVVFLATNFLILKGGDEIGPNLALLYHYFVGYDVTFEGSFIGFVYGFLLGFATGALIAALRNGIVAFYISFLKIKRDVSALEDFIDNP
jgi:hypothetical protein